MLIIISPAKTLDFKAHKQTKLFTIPEFLNFSEKLIYELRQLKPKELMQLMDINHNLAELNYERIVQWQLPFTRENAKQALLAFKGEVYRGIVAEKYSEPELKYAQDHLRILSGLYGILRPLDIIQPYRLEMGTQLANEKGRDLYQFWNTILTNSLNKYLVEKKFKTLINLASLEYSKVLKLKNIKAKIITPVFLELRPNGEFKIITVYAKKARGLMTNFILKNRIENPEEIKHFDWERYSFNPRMSNDTKWTFCR